MSTDIQPTVRAQVDRAAQIMLGMALVLGLIVFVKLGQWSLWYDEALTLTDSLNQSSSDNPVGYLLFGTLYKAILAAGERPDEWQMRIVPAVLGWLGVPLTWWAFRRAAGERVAAAAALIFAVSSWHLYWSQSARFYTLAQDFVLLGSGFGLRALFPGAISLLKRRLHLGLGLGFFGLAALVHPTSALVGAAFIAAALSLGCMGKWVPNSRDLLAGGIGKTLLVVTVIGVIGASLWIGPIYRLWVSNKGGGTPAHLILTIGFFVTPLLGAAGLFGVFDAWRRRSRFGLLAALVLIFGVGSAVAVSFVARFTGQYIFAFLPWFCVLAAIPAGAIQDARARLLSLALVGLLVMTGLTNDVLYMTVRAGERPHWREAYAFVWNQREPGDQIWGMAGEVGEYYLDPKSTNLRNIESLTFLMKWTAKTVRNWARENRRAWIVINREEFNDWPSIERQEFEAMLVADCRLIKAWPLYVESRDLSVEVYLKE